MPDNESTLPIAFHFSAVSWS